jgi:1-acyl-sn-glycerol-3-phosphate acyltransferase
MEEQHPRHGIAYRLGKAWLDAHGWRVEGGAPPVRKAVIAAAPHTSNWDFAYALSACAVLGVKVSWVGKHTLFKPPFGALMRALGGVPVDRRAKGHQVERIAALFEQRDELFLMVAPEGTRSRATRWKTGFYRIAVEARVPIVLGYLDYSRKVAGLGTVFQPSGDPDADLPRLREFYQGIQGRYPERMSDIRFHEE